MPPNTALMDGGCACQLDQTPKEWISILKTATQPLEEKIRSLVVEKDKRFIAIPENQLGDSLNPLPLNLIVNYSLEYLKNVQQDFLNKKLNDADYLDQTEDIALYTGQFIDQSSQPSYLRRFLLLLSAILSPLLIGIPFFLKMKREDEKLIKQQNQFKEQIEKAKESNFQVLVKAKLEELPSLVDRINKEFTDKRKQALLNKQIFADWEEDNALLSEEKASFDPEFERDIKSGATFIRIDRSLNIEDKEPVPAKDLGREQRVEKGLLLLDELLVKPADLRWREILQLLVTHANLLTAFKAALSAFNISVTHIQWEASGLCYSLKAVFSDDYPPVIIEVKRHLERNNIERVDVKVKGSMDIVIVNLEGKESPKMVFPHVVSESLTYFVSFDEKTELPRVEHLHSELAMHTLKPQSLYRLY